MAIFTAHPHSRGENEAHELLEALSQGSSPLTRGKPVHIWNIARAQGLIPTHAGKTYAGEDVIFAPRAHPHSRGENAGVAGRVANERGSSPLTRGKRGGRRKGQHVRGLIPTHAGKTLPMGTGGSSAAAHPHSRGENVRVLHRTWSLFGSSPLTRGKRSTSHRWPGWTGLIPTHAGKTTPLLATSNSRQAHPHSRGENGGFSY